LIKIVEKDGAVVFYVKVVPRSSRGEIIGEHDGTLKIKLKSTPVDGGANAELIKLLAKQLNVSTDAIQITSGHTSKSKRIRISRVTSRDIEAVLKAKT
jgi:uncharacterized protein